MSLRPLKLPQPSPLACEPAEGVRKNAKSLTRSPLPSLFLNVLSLTNRTGIPCNPENPAYLHVYKQLNQTPTNSNL